MSSLTITPRDTMERLTADLAAVDAVGEAGLQRVNQLTNNVLGVVDTLNDQISGVLAKQEKEFLRAYRAHMYTVQRELQSLRAKADEAALQMQRDERMKALIAERDWYRSESLRLDQFSTSLKGELDYLRDKIYAIEEDRNWLDKEVKLARRKVMQLERANAGLRGEMVAQLDGDELDASVRGSSRASSPVRPAPTPVGSRAGTAPASSSPAGQAGLRSPLRATGGHASGKAEGKASAAVSESKTGLEGTYPHLEPHMSRVGTAKALAQAGSGSGQQGQGVLASMSSREILNLLGGGKVSSVQQPKHSASPGLSAGVAAAAVVTEPPPSRASVRR